MPTKRKHQGMHDRLNLATLTPYSTIVSAQETSTAPAGVQNPQTSIIVGVAIGSALGLTLVIGSTWCYMRRKRDKHLIKGKLTIQLPFELPTETQTKQKPRQKPKQKQRQKLRQKQKPKPKQKQMLKPRPKPSGVLRELKRYTSARGTFLSVPTQRLTNR